MTKDTILWARATGAVLSQPFVYLAAMLTEILRQTADASRQAWEPPRESSELVTLRETREREVERNTRNVRRKEERLSARKRSTQTVGAIVEDMPQEFRTERTPADV